MSLTGKERRKYLAALKEKNASGEHIASDPADLLLRKGKKDQGAARETPGGDASGSNKGTADDFGPSSLFIFISIFYSFFLNHLI